MKFAAIEQVRDEFPVSRQCQVLGVSESGYYAWRDRLPSCREQERMMLTEVIYSVWEYYRGIYGAPRIHEELRARGFNVGHNRVAKVMREMGIQGKMCRKKRPRTTTSDPTHTPAPNRLDRDFNADQCDQIWLTDITYINTHEGDLYLAGIMDLFSRQIVGLSMEDHLRTELVEQAFDMALLQRQPEPGLVHHSDRGSQYTSGDYQKRLLDAHMLVSMSRTGNCLDNAPMESFWATLKRECADVVFDSHAQARSEIFRYIMGFYNRERRHSALGYLSPVAYEQQHLRNQCTLPN